MSAAWDAYERSTVARHEWKGLSKSSSPLQDWVEKQTLEGAERAVGPRATRHRRPMTRSRRRQYEAEGMSESMSEDEDD
jgi:DDB1- and CUL4-associated factor 11